MKNANIKTECGRFNGRNGSQGLWKTAFIMFGCFFPMFGWVSAAEKTVVPHVLVSSQYISNPLLDPNGSPSTVSLISDVDIRLSYNTEDASLQLRPRYRKSRHEDYPQLDHDDRYLSALGKFSGPRSQFNVDMAYAEESTRVTELLDTGFVEQDIPRVSLSIMPSGAIELGEKGILRISANTTDVEYDGTVPADSELFDYGYGSVSVSYDHLWTQRLSLLSSVYQSAYDAEDIESHTDSVGLILGFRYAFYEYISASVDMGIRRNESRFIDINDMQREVDDEGFTANLGIDRELQTGSVSVWLTRSVVPSSAGTEYEQDKISLVYQTQLRPRLDMKLEVLYLENRILVDDFFLNNRNREYAALDARVHWKLNPHWLLQAHFRNNGQRYEFASETAASYLFGIALVYQNDKWFL